MRFASLLLGVALSTAACSCVHNSGTPPKAASADELLLMRQETIALVNDRGIFCAGVWISPTQILTAAHCTEPDEAREDGKFGFVTYDGMIASSESHNYTTLFADVKARDVVADLALLEIDFSIGHPYAALGGTLESGDGISIIGHTMGLGWSYTPGFVSGYRDMKGPDGIKGLFLQTWAGVAGGNSGGGAFDANGNLVGICSFAGKGVAFFVARPGIGAFLKRFA